MNENVNADKVIQQENEPDKKQQGDKVTELLNGLANGECKGVKGATAYKIAEYAQKKGLVG